MFRLVLCLVGALALEGCGYRYPEIRDEEQLVKACDLLLAGGLNRMIDPAQYPAAVRELHPVYVCVNDYDVMVATQAGGDTGVHGYFVSHTAPFGAHLAVEATQHPGIYRFAWAR